MKRMYRAEAADGTLLAMCQLHRQGARAKMLQTIIVKRNHRGQGHGSRLLDEVLNDADKEGITLYLAIMSMDGGLSNLQLRRWYERRGFTEKNALIHVRKPKLQE